MTSPTACTLLVLQLPTHLEPDVDVRRVQPQQRLGSRLYLLAGGVVEVDHLAGRWQDVAVVILRQVAATPAHMAASKSKGAVSVGGGFGR